MRPAAGRDAWAPWLVGGAALLISAWKAGVPGLWYDEVVTLTMAERSWASMLRMLTQVDAVHAVYYALLQGWIGLVDYTPFTLRLPSAVAVAATSGVLVRLGQRQWSLTAGVIAGLVFVLLPRSQWMATQARSYALAALLATVVVYLFLVALDRRRDRYWVVFTIACTVAVYVFVYNVLLLAVLAAAVWRQRPPPAQARRFLTSSATTCLLALPLVAVAIGQRQQIAWIDRTRVADLLAPYYGFLDGTNSLVVVIGWVVFLAVGAVLLISASLREPQSADILTASAALVLVLGWVVLPMLALLAVGLVFPVYNPSYLAISAPALALLVGAGYAALGRRSAVAVVVIAGLLAYAPWSFHRSPNAKSDMLDAVALVQSVPGAEAIVFVEGEGWDTRQLRHAYPAAFEGLVDVTLDVSYESGDTFFGTSRPLWESTAALAGVDRVILLANGPNDSAGDLLGDAEILQREGFQTVAREQTGDWRMIVLDRPSPR